MVCGLIYKADVLQWVGYQVIFCNMALSYPALKTEFIGIFQRVKPSEIFLENFRWWLTARGTRCWRILGSFGILGFISPKVVISIHFKSSCSVSFRVFPFLGILWICTHTPEIESQQPHSRFRLLFPCYMYLLRLTIHSCAYRFVHLLIQRNYSVA